MKFDYGKSWNKFEEIFSSDFSINEKWNQIIDFHESLFPETNWTALRQVIITAESDEIKEWLEKLVIEEPFNAGTIAFWIGLTKFLDEETENEFYVIYLTGCKNYEINNIEWATDPGYIPENRYFSLDFLNKIDRIILDDKNYSFLDWILPICAGSFVLDDIIKCKLDLEKFLKYKDKMFVTFGFDDGDYIPLTPLRKE
ncbi:MAG: hypothetical protein AB9834_08680 [Lentimicrobium sp.]